ncbi:MAG: DUF4126 domain-containing protein [Gammaproteobacteria bacterium]|nr:DUF4126 domain-containing protein [Gammaproteobacteria bacterium]
MDIVDTIALTMGVAWASGINLYAALFMLGYMGVTGNIELPPDLLVLQNPLVMAAAGFMYCVEFFADKIPGVDSTWDTMHTFIRIPAGAMLAGAAVGDVNQGVEFAALILGGTLSAGTHFTKAGSRLLINTSPEPVTNWTASITEDLAVIGGLWAALNHPVLFLIALALFIALVIWLLPKLWRGIKRVGRAIGRLFGRGQDETITTTITPPDTAGINLENKSDSS